MKLLPHVPRPDGATHVYVGTTFGVHFWARQVGSGEYHRWELWSQDAAGAWGWYVREGLVESRFEEWHAPMIALPGTPRPPGATHVLQNEYEPFRFWARMIDDGRCARWEVWARNLGEAEFEWTDRGASHDFGDYVEVRDPLSPEPGPYLFEGRFATVRLEPPTSGEARDGRLFKLVDGRFVTYQSADRLRAWLDAVFPVEPDLGAR